MSNAAVIASISRDLTASMDGLGRVSARAASPWARTEIESARASIAEAQFKLAIAARSVDPVLEAVPA